MSATANQNQKEITAQFAWTGFILAFFLIQAIIWIVAITYTLGDVSHAVVSGYDEQALRWDEIKSMRNASASLGWLCAIEVSDVSNIRGIRRVTCSLKDRAGQPVADANVKVQAFHVGRAGDKQRLQMVEVEPGIYESQVRIRRTGNWQFSGRAHRADAIFLIDQRLFVAMKENR
jgi:nitrogen fixation protein FixH